MSCKIRFAPSPTGDLHIGNLEIILANLLFAKHNTSTFQLRIDFTGAVAAPSSTSIYKFVESVDRLIRYLGFHIDELIIQNYRKAIYRKYASALRDAGIVDVRDGIWRIRTNSPEKEISVHDMIYGDLVYKEKDITPIIIYDESSDRYFYNFVSIVDDLETGVTHIIRGSDHLDNSVKQYFIAKKLQSIFPRFVFPRIFSIPLCRLPQGAKLSKTLMVDRRYTIDYLLYEAKIVLRTLFSYFFGDRTRSFRFPFHLERISKNYRTVNIPEIISLNTKILYHTEYSEIIHHLNVLNIHMTRTEWDLIRENISTLDDIDTVRSKIHTIYSRLHYLTDQEIEDIRTSRMDSLRMRDIRREIFLDLRNPLIDLIHYFIL